MSNEIRILLVDDEQELCLSLAKGLKAAGAGGEIRVSSDPDKAGQVIKEWEPHVVVSDLGLVPGEGVESGFRLLKNIVAEAPFCNVIVLTGNTGVENGIRALNSGASSFLEKPVDVLHLAAIVRDCVQQSLIRREYDKLKKTGSGSGVTAGIICESSAMQSVMEQLKYAAATTQPVLLTGETGTGKGLCAQIIHKLSGRSAGRLVRYQPNFSSADLVNSDLFGHLKGAFTGAGGDRRGLIAEADRGTLFLDEIDELPGETQVALLGVLQDKIYRALGSDKEQKIDFRLVSATNRDIEECLNNGKLRRDFYHRAAHLQIKLPPLRGRLADIDALSRFFMESLRDREEVHVFEIGEQALSKLRSFDWPGNVRQLQAVIEGAAFHAQFNGRSAIKEEDLHLREEAREQVISAQQTFNRQVGDYKLRLVKEALARNNGNQVKAAEELGLDRSTLRRILAKG